jgi:hypothetical protein
MQKYPGQPPQPLETTMTNTTDSARVPAQDPAQFHSFAEFYRFYLTEHSNLTCRRLPFVGSSLVLASILLFFVTGAWVWLMTAPLWGYGFAWIGHFGFEKNKPASFKRPLYSFMGDWVMYKDILIGKVKI